MVTSALQFASRLRPTVQPADNLEATPPAASPTWRFSLHTMVFIGVAAVVLVTFVALSRQTAPLLPSHTFASTVPQHPDPVVETTPATEQAPPVRFANPFDKAEVFEFPAGTTRREARAAVAEILRQRAIERQESGAINR
jgi:hypothetical protein